MRHAAALLTILFSYGNLATDFLLAMSYASEHGTGSWQFIATATVPACMLAVQCIAAISLGEGTNHAIFALCGLKTLIVTLHSMLGHAVFGGGHDAVGSDAQVFAARSTEVIFECVPQALLQLVILMQVPYDNWSTLQMVNISASLGCAVWMATLCDLGLDSSLKYRLFEPLLYGMYPSQSSSRLRACVGCMVMLLGQMTGRLLAAAALGTTDPYALALWLTAELALYNAAKVFQSSWYMYNLPAIPSLVFNIAAYIGATTIPMPVLRIPHFVGSPLYAGCWLWTLLSNHLVLLYVSRLQGGVAEDINIVYVQAVATAASVFGMAVLLWNINAHFRHTFYRHRTVQHHCRHFLWNHLDYSMYERDIDGARASVLRCISKRYWPVDEVTDWMNNNWAKWQADPPMWFTEEWQQTFSQTNNIHELPGGCRAPALAVTDRAVTATERMSHKRLWCGYLQHIRNCSTADEAMDKWTEGEFGGLSPYDRRCLSTVEMDRMVSLLAMHLHRLANVKSVGFQAMLLTTLIVAYADTISDVILGVYYLQSNRIGMSVTTLSFVGIMAVSQAALSATFKQKPVDILYSLLLVKELVESFRLLYDVPAHQGQLQPTVAILSLSRFFEVALESVPQCVAQATALVSSSSSYQLVSILTSSTATGWLLAVTDKEMDYSEYYNKYDPLFYGSYDRNSRAKRVVMTICVTLLCGATCLSRALSIGGLLHASTAATGAWLVGEYVFVVLVRAYDRCLVHYTTSNAIACTFILGAIWVGCTSAPLSWWRHVAFMSPHVWLGGIVYSHTVGHCMIAVAAHIAPDSPAVYAYWPAVAVCSGVAVCGVVGILVCANDSHRWTYYRRYTLHMYAQQLWNQEGYSDKGDDVEHSRAAVLCSFIEHYWPPQAEQWIQDNWESWVREPPAFFDDEFIDLIPERMRPQS